MKTKPFCNERVDITTSRIMHWDPKPILSLPFIRDDSSRCTYLLRELRVKNFRQSLSYFSTILRLHIDRQYSRNFQPLHRYSSVIMPTPLIKPGDAYSAIHVMRVPLRTYPLQSYRYSSNGISYNLYHLFRYHAPCLVFCLFYRWAPQSSVDLNIPHLSITSTFIIVDFKHSIVPQCLCGCKSLTTIHQSQSCHNNNKKHRKAQESIT